MADIIELEVVVKKKGLDEALSSVTRLENKIGSAAKKVSQGKMSWDRFNQTLLASKREYEQLGMSSQKATSRIQAYARQMLAAEGVNEMFSSSAQASAAALNQQTQAFQRSTKNAKQFGSIALQQVGYQVSDFTVQVQGGTNALVAFGQQGSQLAGLLFYIPGLVGAIAGSVASIAIPLATAVLHARQASQEAGAATEQYKELGEAVSALEEVSLENLTKDVEEGARNAANEYRALLGLIQQVRLQQLKDEMKSVTDSIVDDLESVLTTRNLIARGDGTPPAFDFMGLDSLEKGLFLVQQMLDLNGETREELVDQVNSMREALELRGALTDEVKLLINGLATELGLLEVIKERQEEYNEETKEAEESVKELGNNLRNATNETIRLRDAMASVGTAALSTRDNIVILRAQIAAARSGGSVEGAAAGARTAIELGRAGASIDQIARGSQEAAALATQEASLRKLLGTLTKDSKSGGGSSKMTYDAALAAIMQLQSQYDSTVASAVKLQQAQERMNKVIEAHPELAEAAAGALQKYEEHLNKLENPMIKVAETMSQAFGDAFMSIVDGSKSASDAFKDMARAILSQAFELLVIKPIMDSLFGADGTGGLFGGLLGFSNGASFSNGKITPFAMGGVVSRPTLFPMANGTGLMGEAGPEAIMPLTRGADGKLGVKSEGGGSVVIHQNFNMSANGDESVRRIIQQEAPKIAQYTQKTILDSRSRGGAFKNTFGN